MTKRELAAVWWSRMAGQLLTRAVPRDTTDEFPVPLLVVLLVRLN